MIRRPKTQEFTAAFPRFKHLGQIGNDFGEIRVRFPELDYRHKEVFDQELTEKTWNFPQDRGGKFTSIKYAVMDGVFENNHPLTGGKDIIFRLFRGFEEGQSKLRSFDHGMDLVALPEDYQVIWKIIEEMGLSIWPQRDVVSRHNPMKRFLVPDRIGTAVHRGDYRREPGQV